MPAQPAVGLKLGQQEAEWTLSPALARPHYPHFGGNSLGYPAAGVRMVDGSPGIVGMIAEKWESSFHNNSNYFYKCNNYYCNFMSVLENKSN